MEVDIEEDKNEPELTYPYEEMVSLNPPPPVSEFEPDDEIEVEDAFEPEIETVPVSVYEVGESSTAAIPREDEKGKEKGKFYGKLILDLGNEVHFSLEQGTATMETLVEKLGNVEDKVECKKLKKELKETRGFVFEERPSEAINVSIEDEKSPSSKSQGSPHDP
ncbi:hypothetical protein Tco_1014949 [Tanacetum coccineum]